MEKSFKKWTGHSGLNGKALAKIAGRAAVQKICLNEQNSLKRFFDSAQQGLPGGIPYK